MLRLIATQLGLPSLQDVVRLPGISEGYRITIRYHDARHPDQVATLTRDQQGVVMLSMIYKRTRHHPSFEYRLESDRYRDFDLAMRRLGYDRRGDQPDLPLLNTDLWLIERASGSYRHEIVLAPALAEGVYGWMVDAVRHHLPQAVRAIQPD
jgi:hypothetical protein